jgi:hypothetical protein
MHGAAVLSIATGKIGVAPDARVVYCGIETWNERRSLLQNHAKGLRQLRGYFEDGNRLDAVSTSHGWNGGEPCAKENDGLVAWFEEHNVPVFSTNDPIVYPCGRNGLAENWRCTRRPPVIRPNQIAIPVDDRLIACRNRREINSCGDLYYRMAQGGASWGPPFLAGLFLLARELRPNITRIEFERTLLGTARQVNFARDIQLPLPEIEAFCAMLSLDRPSTRPTPAAMQSLKPS